MLKQPLELTPVVILCSGGGNGGGDGGGGTARRYAATETIEMHAVNMITIFA